MNVEPARVSQVRLAENGRLVEIDQDVGHVAERLRQIDPGLKVRFGENSSPPVWIVYHEHHDGCPRNGDGGPGSTYLVTTRAASMTRSGVWVGLYPELVDRILEIGSEHYDYVGALERHNRAVQERREKANRERLSELNERGAHALRKDLNLGPYKGRVFLPDGIGR